MLNENKNTSKLKSENAFFEYFSQKCKKLTYMSGVGLLLLLMSPFFRWINFGNGGILGISGDGKILLALTAIALIGYTLVIFRSKQAIYTLIAIQCWGIITVFWMGSIIWEISNLFSTNDLNNNPFAFLLSSQIGPGSGLYLGLLGGIVVTGTIGFMFVRKLVFVKSTSLFYASQIIACFIGIVIAATLSDRPFSNQKKIDEMQSSIIENDNTKTYPQNTLLTPSLINKKFQTKGYREAICLDIKWSTSHLEKPIRAVKGILHITDIFGEPRVSSKFTIDTPMYPNQEYIQKDYRIEYNQFIESHSWLSSTPLNNLKVVFEITNIMYLDAQSIQELRNINNKMQEAKTISNKGGYSKAKSILDDIINKWQIKYPYKIKEARVLQKDTIRKIELKEQQIKESNRQKVCDQISRDIQAVKKLIEKDSLSEATTSLSAIIESCHSNCPEKLVETRNLMTILQQKKERKENMKQLTKLKSDFELAIESHKQLQQSVIVKTSRLYWSKGENAGLYFEFSFKNNTDKTISRIDIDCQTISLESFRNSEIMAVNLNLDDGLKSGTEKTFYIKPYSGMFISGTQALIARPTQIYDPNGNPIFAPNFSADAERELESIAKKYSETKISIESSEVLGQYRELQKINTNALLQYQIKNEITELENLKSQSIDAENQKNLFIVKAASYSKDLFSDMSILKLECENKTNAIVGAIKLRRAWTLPDNSWMGRDEVTVDVGELQPDKSFSGNFKLHRLANDDYAPSHLKAKFTVEVLHLFDKDMKELFSIKFTPKNEARLILLKKTTCTFSTKMRQKAL